MAIALPPKHSIDPPTSAIMKTPQLSLSILMLALLFSVGSILFADEPLMRQDLQSDADQWHTEHQQPSEGISLGEIHGHNRVYASAGHLNADGSEVDEKTLYEIGSISKVFTGILLADTVLQGKAKLEDSIGEYLPEGVLEDDSPLYAVTLLQLTTHTSGLPRLPADLDEGAWPNEPYAHYSRERMMKYLHQFTAEDFDQPGTYAYSNLGVGLLGEILAMIHDTDYATLLQQRILTPLKMDSTWVQVSKNSVPEALKARFATGHKQGEPTHHWALNAFSGAGAIVSSAEDMLTFAEAHWSEDTPEYLKKAFELAMQSHSEKMGLGWMLMENGVQHGGATGGFRAQLKLQPDEQYAIVSLKNSGAEAVETSRDGEFSKLAGFWSGTLDVGAAKLRLVFWVSETGDVNMYSLDQGGFLIPNAGASFDADTREFVVTYPMISGTLKTTLGEDGVLRGDWSQGQAFPIELVASAAMPASLEDVFERVYEGDLSKLVGYWCGTLGSEPGIPVFS